jgi:hypothetical protein
MVYLAYEGMQNMFLTEQPDFTHFKSVYSREMQFVSRTREIPFDQTSYRPGDTLISTLPRAGDYIEGMSLKIILPKIEKDPPPPTNWVWPYTPIIGDFMYGFDSSGNRVFTVSLNSRTPTTAVPQNWYTASPGITVSAGLTKFTFTTSTPISYVIFSNFETARLFGFLYNPIQLFGGYLRFNTITSQATYQECGWLLTPTGSTFSYVDDTCYKLINTVRLYIGKQLIQEFDSTSIKTYKETNTNYKNRPVLKLLEGDTSVVDFNRTYYFELPFIDIPMYAIPKHDIQVQMDTNPLTNLIFYASVVVNFDYFSNVDKLPMTYTLPVKQLYFSNRPKCDIRGPVSTIFTRGDPNFTFYLNGEKFCDSDTSNIAAFENFTNMPLTSNAIVFDGPINMSRIRDQNFQSSNTVVYATVTNILRIENNLAGLMFDYSDIRDSFPKVSSNALVEYTPAPAGTLYLFDYIPATASNVVSVYSMRRVSILYTGPVVRIRNSVTLAESDFYTDNVGAIGSFKTKDGVTFEIWSNGQVCNATRWYDQSGNGNFFYDATQAPIFTTQNGKYVLYFNNPSNIFTISRYSMQSSTFIYGQQILLFHKPNTFPPQERGDILNPGSVVSYTTSETITTNPSMTQYNNNELNGPVPLDTWSTFAAYAGSQFGPINLLCNTNQNIATQVYTGYLSELGFFNGTSVSTERNAYYNNKPF